MKIHISGQFLRFSVVALLLGAVVWIGAGLIFNDGRSEDSDDDAI